MTKRLVGLGSGLCVVLLAAAATLQAAPTDVNARLKEAATEVSYLSFDLALPIFADVQREAPEGSDQWQAAVFGQAVCLQQMAPVTADRLQQAKTLYGSLIERYPTGKYATESMMAMGRIAELVDYLGDQPDRQRARDWYEKARSASPADAPLAHEATLRIAATHVQSYEPDECMLAVDMLDQWLKRYPNNPLASAMWQYAGDTWFWPIGDEKKAVSCYLKADELGLLEEGREGPLYWRLAVLAQRNGLTDVAIQYYTKIIVKTPTSGKAYESQLALRNLGAPVPEIELFKDGKKADSPATEPDQAQPAQMQPAEKP